MKEPVQNKSKEKQKGYTVYLHFSFRKPSGENYGLFSTACFFDKEFTKLITKSVTADVLWEPDSQHINSIQSYYKALEYIYKHQVEMMNNNISHVVLVTNNSSLVNWIMGRGRNKYYIQYVDKICKPFRFGAPKEIALGVGLMEAVENEKSKKYCLDKNADNLNYIKEQMAIQASSKSVSYQLEFRKPTKVKSIFDFMKSEDEPDVVGDMKEL